MASDIGVKMSVSGIAQFKSAMTQGKSAVKQLDAELKLNAAQYKASGDAEEYMAGRTRILSQQIKAQEGVVESCEKALETMATQGVDKTSASYTKMAAELAKAKTDLINMRQAAADTGDELKEMGQDADQATKSLQSIDKSTRLNVLTNALGRADQLLTSMLRSIVNISKGIWDMSRDAADWADTLTTDATKYGIDVETLQRWQAAEKIVDVTVEDIIKATDKITAATKGVEDDVALIMAGTGQIGVQIRDETGAMRSQMDIFWDYVEALGKVENETERNALAQEIFGKSYRELIPLIKAGRESWEKAAENASVVSEEDIEKLNKYNNTLDEFDQNLNATKMQLMAQLAPAFEKVANALDYMVSRFAEWAESPQGQKTIDRLGDSIANFFETIADSDLLEKTFNMVADALDKIASALEKITSDDIKNGLIAIAAIVGTINAAKFGSNVANIVNAFKGGKNGYQMFNNPTQTGSTPNPIETEYQPTDKKINPLLNLFKDPRAWLSAALEVAVPTVAVGAAAYITMKQVEKGYNDTNYATGTTPYDEKERNLLNLFNWQGYLQKTGKELRYGADIANASIKFPVEFLEWDATKGSGAFANFGENAAARYLQLEQALASGLINESDYYRAEAQLDKAQELYNAFVYGWNEYDTYGFKDYNHVLNELTGGSAESGVQEYAEFAAIFEGIFGDIDKLTSGLEEGRPVIQDAGSEMTASFAEGVLDNVDAAFAAGEALGAAFTSGAGTGGSGNPGSTTNYNSNNVNQVNVYGAQSPAEIAAAYQSYTQGRQAGYGG